LGAKELLSWTKPATAIRNGMSWGGLSCGKWFSNGLQSDTAALYAECISTVSKMSTPETAWQRKVPSLTARRQRMHYLFNPLPAE
ncbi:MAG: hypothetical protein ACK4YU_09575, partial [Paracoccus sp. (in: a-proteobacteria)]